VKLVIRIGATLKPAQGQLYRLVRAIQALWCQIEIDVKVKVPPLYRQTIQTWVTVGVKVKA
jgi:hypothetical protein